MLGVVTLVLVRAEPDLSIIDVETEQSQTGTGGDTHRVPESRAPGGENTILLGAAPGPAQDSSVFPGKPEPFLVRVGAATEHLLTGSSRVAA